MFRRRPRAEHAVIGAVRHAVSYEPGQPETDPLKAGVLRWLGVIPDANERATVLERLAGLRRRNRSLLRKRLV